jgi:beta-lactamase class A
MKRLAWILLLLVLPIRGAEACPGQGRAPADQKAAVKNLKRLERDIQRVRQRLRGQMAVYMKNLATGEEIALDADRVYETFSVIKVPIMVEVLRQVEGGRMALSDRIELRRSDARWPSGVLYAMDPGLQPTIQNLLTLMIIISDNSATDMLADRVGRDRITQTMRELGLTNTSIRYSDLDWDRRWLGFLDARFLNETAEGVMQFPFEKYTEEQVSEAFRKVIEETDVYFGHSTAREIGRLFEWMAQGKLVSESASRLMLNILKKQQATSRIPRYLRNASVAHKTGDGTPWVANDAGVLWVGEQPIVLVVFTSHHRGTAAEQSAAIGRVAALVVRHYGGETSPDFKP